MGSASIGKTFEAGERTGQVPAAIHPEEQVDLPKMGVDGANGDEKFVGDVAAGHSGGGQLGDFLLPSGETCGTGRFQYRNPDRGHGGQCCRGFTGMAKERFDVLAEGRTDRCLDRGGAASNGGDRILADGSGTPEGPKHGVEVAGFEFDQGPTLLFSTFDQRPNLVVDATARDEEGGTGPVQANGPFQGSTGAEGEFGEFVDETTGPLGVPGEGLGERCGGHGQRQESDRVAQSEGLDGIS